eukprot:TRINITY_DN6706_c0_g1_i1.p1 TRINITY_DN6706_c0_g1~~TRINITY_DN6706_c0_g1_i1.p1  ORF type:complete len:132 (-),score=12.41 TRINITY_DN6706_c0_g1_i1:46-441(-)
MSFQMQLCQHCYCWRIARSRHLSIKSYCYLLLGVEESPVVEAPAAAATTDAVPAAAVAPAAAAVGAASSLLLLLIPLPNIDATAAAAAADEDDDVDDHEQSSNASARINSTRLRPSKARLATSIRASFSRR